MSDGDSFDVRILDADAVTEIYLNGAATGAGTYVMNGLLADNGDLSEQQARDIANPIVGQVVNAIADDPDLPRALAELVRGLTTDAPREPSA